ncbi:MAG: hypothetical protein ACOY90_08835 [Candidatus Zhuqueibacterota bacterium]
MSIKVVEKIGDVKIYGAGSMGGKGEGLVKINECNIPAAHKLPTRVLTTVFFDHYLMNDRRFTGEELEILSGLLEQLGNIPISVRSSATNEAITTQEGGGSVHAGENTSYMLPNNHPDAATRFHQFIQAIEFIYSDFLKKQPPDSREKMAIVINPIPGLFDNSDAGPIYYPLVSGVANSFFPYALKNQNPDEGFARIALGHGYATVLDDFPVKSMVTIRNPISLELLENDQSVFYAIDMSKNAHLSGEELETMKKLHVRFSHRRFASLVGEQKNMITLENLIQQDRFGFKSGLCTILDIISAKITAHYQIEFVFNLTETSESGLSGQFHVVQLTQLPVLKFEAITFPENFNHQYLSISNFQGHGIKTGVNYAVTVSPFIYSQREHDAVLKKIAAINQELQRQGQGYVLIAPGRLGSSNRNWGIQVEYRDVAGAVALFEYGVDISGRAEPQKEASDPTGGIYGSHFLYMIQGGFDEEQKRQQTRMYGTQGTHFLTNLMSNNVIYGFISPIEDSLDPWFFTPSSADDAVYVLKFPQPVSIYADSVHQRCVIVSQ